MRPSEIRALATDFDRTLTDESLQAAPRALAALRAARAAGLKVLVVSGRDLPFLAREVGDAADLLVGENGCLVMKPGEDPVPVCPTRHDLRQAFAAAAFPLEYQSVLASAAIEHEATLGRMLRAAGVEADLIRNKDRVMVLPRGVDKAAGLQRALALLNVEPARCAAAGDGENDVVMLQSVGYGIAVANAVPDLRAIAAHVTARPGGEGLADWVHEVWLPAVRAREAPPA